MQRTAPQTQHTTTRPHNHDIQTQFHQKHRKNRLADHGNSQKRPPNRPKVWRRIRPSATKSRLLPSDSAGHDLGGDGLACGASSRDRFPAGQRPCCFRLISNLLCLKWHATPCRREHNSFLRGAAFYVAQHQNDAARRGSNFNSISTETVAFFEKNTEKRYFFKAKKKRQNILRGCGVLTQKQKHTLRYSQGIA